MQTYRVNMPLLIGLVVGAVVLLGGSYGLYQFQRERNADRLITRAEDLRAEGELRKSAQELLNYLRLRPNEEAAMVRLSETLMDIANEPGAEMKDLQMAVGQSEATLRDYPEQSELRRRVLDFYMDNRYLKQALDHVQLLLNRNPKDPELELMRSVCYFATADEKAMPHAYELIGYDVTSDSFDVEAAIEPTEPAVYARVAMTLRRERGQDDEADRFIEQMITANPESGMALLARGQYFSSIDREDEAKQDYRAALKLEPKTPAIVIANAILAAEEERFDEGRKLITAALDENKDKPGLYQALADIEVRAERYEEAMAICDQGIEAVPRERGSFLLFKKAQLQLQFDTREATEETIRQMRQSAAIGPHFPDYLEARLLMEDGEWFKAARIFEKYSTALGRQPGFAADINNMLGLCREELNQLELAQEAYARALEYQPENTMAALSEQRAIQKRGGTDRPADPGFTIYQALAAEVAKPPAQQDWKAFDELAQQYVEKTQRSPAMLEILRAEVFMRRGMYAEARKKLLESYEMDRENIGVRRAAVMLFAADPDKGAAKALTLLDAVVKDFGDMPILRLDRADLLIAVNDEDLTNQLLALTEENDEWTRRQQTQLYSGLAERFQRINDSDNRLFCLQKVVETAPGDLPTLQEIFSIRLASGDKQGASDAQEKILAVVGNKEDAVYRYTEATRLLYEWQTAGQPKEMLQEVDEIVNLALAQRDGWAELHTLKGRVQLAQGDVEAALKSYDRAAGLGRQDGVTLLQYIQLLMRQQRYADALVKLEQVNKSLRERLFGRDYAECLLRVRRYDESVAAAKGHASLAPNNAATQLWLGRYLMRVASVLTPSEADLAAAKSSDAEKDRVEKQLAARRIALFKEAGEPLNRVVEIDPTLADGWLSLVRYYSTIQERVAADDAIRRAQLVLAEDRTPLLFARCYQLVGRRMDAEALYKSALDRALDQDRATIARASAEFYLSPSYALPDNVTKATPLINAILREAAEYKESNPGKPNPALEAHARWARTQAARLLAKSGTYQELRDAENLLASNATDGVLPAEDRLLMAEILAPRPEPVSRLKATQLLEELGQNQRMSKAAEMSLGQLYFALGRWRECQDQMLDLIARYRQDRDVRVAFLEMLLQRGGSAEMTQAVQQIKRLSQISGNDPKTRELLARIAYKRGRKKEAVATLLQMLPRNPNSITKEFLPVLKLVASKLDDFGEHEEAGKLLQIAASKGDAPEKLVYAQHVGQHFDVEKSLELATQLRDAAPPAALAQVCNSVLRSAVNADREVTPEQFATVGAIIDRGLRDDPEMVALQLQKAEWYDVQQQYSEAVTIYENLLSRSDVRDLNRAIVLNNLAYLLALSKSDPESISQADEYIADAVDYLGPNTDILDTRAVISIAAKRYEEAVADLKLAVIDRPTASKYFHLAVAYAGAGENGDAQSAWDEAVKRGLTRESVSIIERDRFEEMEKRLSSGGLTSLAP